MRRGSQIRDRASAPTAHRTGPPTDCGRLQPAPRSDTRAYNVCLARDAQEAAICEGPRQAYEVDASDIPARASASRPGAGYVSEEGTAVPPALRPVPLHPGPMPVTAG